MKNEYDVAQDGERRGAFGDAQVVLMLSKRTLSKDDLCWAKGMPGWAPIPSTELVSYTYGSKGVRSLEPERNGGMGRLGYFIRSGLILLGLIAVIVVSSLGCCSDCLWWRASSSSWRPS